jgi:putative copper resistance protein D
MLMNSFSWHHLNEWQLNWPALVTFALLAVGYALRVRRLNQRGITWSPWCSVAFASGLIVSFLATESVIGVYDMSYLSFHMIQHLLLIMVAAPLFALSRPFDLLGLSGGAGAQRFLASRGMRVLMHPITGFAAYFVFIPVAHLSGLFTLMMQHIAVHHAEQIAFDVIGYLFFRVAFGAEQGRTLHPGLRLLFVMAAVPVDTFTGLALMMSNHLPFEGYLATMPPGTSFSAALANVHLGGAIMWIGGDALMLLACIPVVVQWVRWETKETKRTDAALDALGL